jgi:antitoxin ParD1/3/4
MAKETSFSLGKHFDKFIARQVNSGRYKNASEVLREGLRMLEDKLAFFGDYDEEWLHSALEEGKKSGIDEDFDFDTFKDEVHKKHEIQEEMKGKVVSAIKEANIKMDRIKPKNKQPKNNQ